MKKSLLIVLFAALLLLSACGLSLPIPSAAPAPAEADVDASDMPVPETMPPEEPGTGRIMVHMSHTVLDVLPEDGDGEPKTVSYYLPTVSVTHREEAQEAINATLREDADAFVLDATNYLVDTTGEALVQRVCLVPRQDRLVFTVLCSDRYNGGTESRRALCFNTLTGAQLRFSDLTDDADALLALCSDYAEMMNGTAPDLRAAPTDGHWYLSAEGLVLFHKDGELTVPYPVLMSALSENCMPPEEEPVRGQLYAAYANDIHSESLDILDELTLPDGFESVIFWARGSLRNVRAVAVNDPSMPDGELLWTCSRLADGEAVRFNVTVPENEPLFRLYWETDRGAASAMLCRSGEDGKVSLDALSDAAANPFPEAVG